MHAQSKSHMDYFNGSMFRLFLLSCTQGYKPYGFDKSWFLGQTTEVTVTRNNINNNLSDHDNIQTFTLHRFVLEVSPS